MYSHKVALITGDSKGIGEALRNHFLAHGAIVYGCSRSPVTFSDPHYHHNTLDITSETGVIKLLKKINHEQKQLDILINNAGVASMNHTLLTPGAVADKLMATNVTAAFNTCREAAKLMKKHRTGRIINLVSTAIPALIEGEALYAASKSALLTFSRIFAKEIAPFGITCNCIGPGPVKTDLTHAVPQTKIDKIIASQAIKKYTEFSDIINTVDFFSNEASRMVTGQVIYLGG